MLVANSFDLWQRDTFFSAAEEVQQSTDIMESAYRLWLRERKEGMRPQFWGDLTRELQMSLGTAKWQLEEFEKAVGWSYRRNVDEITVLRHKQFVSVIHEHISRVEESLRESFDGKQPLQWVTLDEDERDDLASFLSGTFESSNHGADKIGSYKSGSPVKRTRKHLNSTADIRAEVQNPSLSYDELDVKQSPRSSDTIGCQPDVQVQKARSAQDSGILEIVIDPRDRPGETLPPLIEATPKEKGTKGGVLSFNRWQRVHWMNQCLSWCTQIKGDLNSTCPGKTKRENQRSRLNSSDTDFSFNETRAPNFRAESRLQSGEGSRKRLV